MATLKAAPKATKAEPAKKLTDAEKAAAAAEREAKRVKRFTDSAPGTVAKAILALRKVGKLTGSRFSYTDAQAEKILTALNTEIEKLDAQFSAATKEPEQEELFSL